MKKISILGLFVWLSLGSLGCFRAKKGEVVTPTGSAEPDKILYEKGLKDLEKGRYEIARLGLQTLLNTYPDSDYKEKAKLAIADSFYKQGGTSGLVQAEAEYKDFMTFFPTSDDADDAQMRVAMTHYKQMEKPDRDRTQAKAAEREFKSMLEQFPDSPLRDEAMQRLREVQEVLAEGDMQVAQLYMMRKRYDASVNRSITVLKEYPDFSQQDAVLFIMGQALEKKKQVVRAGYYYGKIVSDHPLSNYADESRKRLEELNLPIPDVNPEAMARAQAERDEHASNTFRDRMLNMFSRKPDVSNARKASRPPLDLGPERINLDAVNTKTDSPPAPPVSVGDTGGGVAVQIVNRPASEASGETAVPSDKAAPANAQDASAPANKEPAQETKEAATVASTESAPTTAEAANNPPKEDEKADSKKKKTGLKKVFRF
jgi:outer membrane protein assembly factor BamD